MWVMRSCVVVYHYRELHFAVTNQFLFAQAVLKDFVGTNITLLGHSHRMLYFLLAKFANKNKNSLN